MTTVAATIGTTSTDLIVEHDEDKRPYSDLTVIPKSILIIDPISNINTTAAKETDENPAVYNELTKLKPVESSKLPLSIKHVKSSLKAALCESTFVLIVIGFTSIVPTFQLMLGCNYLHECPVSSYIPQYLIVAGITGLSIILLGIIFILLTLFVASRLRAKDARSPPLPVAITLLTIFLVEICFVLFLCAWSIVGSVRILKVWNKVQYEFPFATDYCDPILYRFAYGLLLASIVTYVFACVLSCRQGRKVFIISRHETTLRVLTTDP
ncbi:unnamed protein product [Adineta ricciae]|uniref:Uncharacterized protein n=1 Tax=Adineta ricciae TaxID=249248 RepID=A0A813QQV0_ADIRI|nr:unnamed protein product [Adineta ricciae]